jgi:hypothetical protein
MRYYAAIPILALVLVGCVSPQAKLSAFNDSWVGRPFDDFVRANGTPATQYTMNDGSNLYTFAFGQGSVQMPTNTTVTSPTPGTAYATTTGGGAINLGCVIRVESNPQGLISRIVIERDTIGLWVSSRCHEVLP